MMKKIRESDLIQIDVTYKLNWENFPVFMIGTTDRQNRFHALAIGVIWSDEDMAAYIEILRGLNEATSLTGPEYSPRFIMADGVRALSGAIEAVYPTAKRLMCWSHMKRKVRDRKGLLGNRWAEIESDLDYLQACPYGQLFDAAKQLFMAKVEAISAEFAEYFRSTWLNSNLFRWFEGAAPLHPSTNNGLERCNREIKDHYTYHKRARLSEFLSKMKEFLVDKSSEHLTLAPLPQADLARETLGFQWIHGNPKLQRDNPPTGETIYVVIGSRVSLTPDQFFAFHYNPASITSWDEYCGYLDSYHIVNNRHGFFHCNCRIGLKEKICKHSVGLEYKFHGRQLHPAAHSVPIGQRRPRGRPRNVGNRYELN